MTPSEYARHVLTTEAKPEQLHITDDQLSALMGLSILVGDIVDMSKKSIFYGHALKTEEMIERLQNVAETADVLAAVLRDSSLNVLSPETGFDRGRINKRLLHTAFGKVGESAELMVALFGQACGVEFDKLNFLEEMGDSDWYSPLTYDELGVSEECVRTMNIAKLTLVRYAAKQFTSEDAKTRKKELERFAMQYVLDRFDADAGVGSDVVLRELAALLADYVKSPGGERITSPA